MASQVTLKALGLNYSPNNLALPEGSLLAANNVIVRRDNVVESRRGFKDYSVGLGVSTNPINQLFEYKERLLANYSDKMAFDTLELDSSGRVIFQDFSGSYLETEPGLRMKSIEANKSLYFTTSEGIKKISARTANDLANTSIISAGAIKALDINAELDFQQGQLSGFLPVDSTVAYRVLWGYRDPNANLILGAPSDRITLYNYLSDVVPLDLNTLLVKLDVLGQSVGISNVGTGPNATVTTSTAHGLANGDIVNIVGTTTTPSTVGSFIATVVTPTTFTIPVNVSSGFSGTATLTKSLFSDGNYYNTYQSSIQDDAQTLKDNIVSLAEKLDNDLLFANNTGGGTPYVPLAMSTVQIDSGSIGQVNFSSSPINYFITGDKVKIEGFTTVPVTTNLSLTNIGGTTASPENPASIAYTGSTTITNGQNITITGTNTSSSCNGTFVATVASNTISSTTGGASVAITGITVANPAVITTGAAHGLLAGDAIWISGTNTTTVPAGGLNGLFYVVSTPLTTTLTVSATRGGTAIQTTAVTTGTGTLIKELTVNTSAAHGISTGNYINISGANAAPSINQNWFVTTATSGSTSFKVAPTAAITVQATAGTVRKTTIPVNVSSVTTGTGNISITTGNNLTLFNNIFTLTEVNGTSNYIRFSIPNNTSTYTATAIDSAAKLYSYSYRNIVNTGDNTYTIPLVDINPSIPASSLDLRTIQNNVLRISDRLKSELSGVIGASLKTAAITPYGITYASNAKITVTVPEEIDSNYFYQVYRTRVFEATGNQTLGPSGAIPVTPDDEMRLVYEAFPTANPSPPPAFPTSVSFIDTYPEDLALTNENLYTNPVTGEGIENANDVPPFAKDINVFKNTTFFANTKTRQRLNPFQLLGTSNIGGVNDDKLTIGNSNGSITYLFNPGVQQEIRTRFNSTDSAATIKTNIQNRYVVLNTPFKQYYAWFKYDNQSITFSNVVPSGSITTFTTSVNHNLPSLSEVFIEGLESVVDVNGAQTITVTTPNTFTIAVNCGTVSSFSSATATPYITDATGIQVDLTSADIPSVCGSKLANSLSSIANDLTSSNLLEISGITAATPNTTITTSTDHGLSAGDVVIISGVTQASGTTINGTVTVVGTPTLTSFTIATASLPTGVVFTSSTVATYDVYTSNVDEGIAASPSTNVLGTITNTIITLGDGEDATSSPPKVLLSQVVSRGQAIDETARSLVRVINKQSASNVYAYYISGEDTSPGIINLEAKSLSDPQFYVIANGNGVGESFNPDVSPAKEISGANVITGVGTTFTLNSPSHGLNNADEIIISGSNSDPVIDGVYSVSNCTLNTFDITFASAYISAGTYFAYSKTSETSVSTNEEKQNRIYYSKTSEPDAVPILNYLDVGSGDKAILRIFPLRDSLFVFKEDGLYRISGEEAPFVLGLFDSSCVVAAPDSVDVSNNIIYAWTTKGVSNISESGVTEISRPIDTEILKLASAQFPNFRTITWGVGYDSDNSYTVFTNTDPTDIMATIGFRYSDLTNTWTNIMRTENCGIVLSGNNLLYVGGGEDNIIHEERKTFTRFDYSDADFFLDISNGGIENSGARLYFTSTSDIEIGDTITQNQIVTNYIFNSLLAKLDIDPSVGINTITSTSGASTTITVNTSAAHNMFNGDYVVISGTNSNPSIDGTYQIGNVNFASTSFDITVSAPLTTQATTGVSKRSYELTLPAVNGDNLRDKIVDLALYLDSDPGLTFTNYFNKIDTHSGPILSNSAANPTVITASAPHNLINGRVVTITGVPASPVSIPSLTGKTYTVSNTGTFGSSTTFTVPVSVTTGGSTGLTFDTSANLLSMLDIKACFNGIVANLNSDPGATFSNYKTATEETLIEAVVTFVDTYNNFIDVNLALPWTVGRVTVFKAIPCSLIYAPLTMGDPLSIKQIYEATMMFDNKAFTKATASFSTDLKPEFLSIDFYGQGNGIFGHYTSPGFGYGFFGGLSNSAPFRTIIPRQCQRGRYLNVGFEHKIAREKWALNGITLTGNMALSTRGYR
jgi:hypothetical protein